MDTKPATRNAVIYTRVSTGRQAESGLSLDDQIQRCSAAVESRGWELASHLTDEGLSAKKADNRPGLVEARQMLNSGQADALVVANLSRLARSTIDLCNIVAEADANGWVLVLLDIDLDTSTPSGEMVVTIMGATARYESRLIGQRAEMTHRQLKSRGKRSGQKPILADDVRQRIATARDAGESFRAIADALNLEGVATAKDGKWHASTVSHVCKSVALDAELTEAA